MTSELMANVGKLTLMAIENGKQRDAAITRAEAAEAALATMIEQKEYFRQCWEAAEFKLAERDTPCVWKQDADKWYMTACENAFADMQGSYCPGCGHPIEVAE